MLPEEIEDEETPELLANDAVEAADRAEWERVQHPGGKAGADVEKVGSGSSDGGPEGSARVESRTVG